MKAAAALQSWTEHRGRMVDLGLVAESTWKNQTTIAGVWAAVIGQVDLADIRKSALEIALGKLLRHRSPITVQGDMTVLRQFLNWALDEQLIDVKPRLPTVKAETAEVALPPDAAFLWALSAVPAHHARALEFMMLMGLAPHELERVQVRDMDSRSERWSPTTISVEVGLAIGMRADFTVKQPCRRRRIPMDRRALEIWREATAGGDDTFHPFPRVGAVQRALARARSDPANAPPPGAEHVTPKMMRKWFASKMASNGEAEHVLQRLLGHAPGSKVTRRHYVRSSDEQAVDAMKGISTPEGEG